MIAGHIHDNKANKNTAYVIDIHAHEPNTFGQKDKTKLSHSTQSDTTAKFLSIYGP